MNPNTISKIEVVAAAVGLNPDLSNEDLAAVAGSTPKAVASMKSRLRKSGTAVPAPVPTPAVATADMAGLLDGVVLDGLTVVDKVRVAMAAFPAATNGQLAGVVGSTAKSVASMKVRIRKSATA